MPGHHHRSGGLKQANKKNKRSKASKRSVSRNAGGKVAGIKNSTATMIAQSKADRRNSAHQRRIMKKNEMMRKKRGLDGLPSPPRVIGIISLGNTLDIEEKVRDFILSGADKTVHPHQNHKATVSCKFDVHKKAGSLTLLTSKDAFGGGDGEDDALIAALDLARVCDVLLFLVDGDAKELDENIINMTVGDDTSVSASTSTYGIDWSHLVSPRGDRVLAAIKSQGLPTPVTVLTRTDKDPMLVEDDDCMTMQSMKSLRRSTVKRNLNLKRYVHRLATTEFGKDNDKVLDIDLSVYQNDAMDEDDRGLVAAASASIVRTLCSMSCSPPKWVSNVPRSFLLSDKVEYDATTKNLSLTGFVRGIAPLDVNALFHIPGMGTFPCQSVTIAENPLRKHRPGHRANSGQREHEKVLPNPEIQEPLDMFATPDALDGEQNLIGFEEQDMNSDAGNQEEEAFERPAGWSDYQSSWLDAVDKDVFDDSVDRGELAEQLNARCQSSTASLAPGDMDIEEANDISPEERRALAEQRRKEMQEDLEFPDEVQVNEDQKASERFSRYRSLKSFRNSYWDPKENLPDSYASIYHFSSFKTTQRTVMNDMKEVVKAAENAKGQFFGNTPNGDDEMDSDGDDFLEGCIPSGSYICITLGNVVAPGAKTRNLLVGVSLLSHENKVSVLHMGLSQPSRHVKAESEPTKSKDVLTFRCGWRTWQARPVFSQNNLNCDKHKFERFLPDSGAFFAASVFGPVTYTPCPVMVFRENSDGRDLVATGTMLGADADRIVVKRIILTGYPVRVHKRHATVKYMFYNPEDVKWFKPAELYTKHGLQGNIVESVGEHGTMKCLFNAPVKQHDTVCLPLYKRIYPKFVQAASDRKKDGMTYREVNDLVIY